MPSSPSFFIDNPTSGTYYYSPNSGYWFIPNSGTSVSAYSYAYNSTGGGGGYKTVNELTAVVTNYTGNSDVNIYNGFGVNSVTATSSNGTNGSNIFRNAVRWVAGGSYGSPGSIQTVSGYTGTPTLPTNLSLSTGQATEGSVITISGTYLDGVTSVTFGGGAGASFSFSGGYSSGSLSVTVPNGARNGAIQLSSPNGSSNTSNFNVISNITGFSPSSASTGSNITLTGSGFNNATSVKFPQSGVNATITINNDGNITATVPADSGQGNITVYSAGGSTSAGTFSTTPTVTSYNGVTSGTVGTSVIVIGTGFTQVTAVKFYNGVGATFTVNSNTQITTSVPSGAVTGGVTVTTNSGSATGPTFSVLPSITSLSATSGHVGDSVTINGSGFTGTTAVKFYNGVSATFTVNTDAKITTTVPAGAVQGAISVTNAGGTANSATFGVLPVINSVSPSTAPPGSTVTISGSGFTGTTAVTFYNNVAAASYTVTNDSTISAVVPTGATSGPVTVTNASGSASSSSLTVSSAHVFRTGAWTQAQNVYVYRSGAWVAAAGVFVYRSGSWVSAG